MKNKVILIIGGTGALGKTLIKRYYKDNTIIVFSRDEHKHYHLQKEYPKVTSIVGNIREKDSVMNALVKCNPQVVINAAALKHVPICEDNPYESVKTNIIGHQNVIECVSLYRRPASNSKIETLIFVSTDKACKPINVYGMCKAISEQLYISFAKQEPVTKVVLVRYGNVLESTGSVIPFFKNLLLSDETTYLPITDMNMTRFLLSLDSAVTLIDNAYRDENSHGKIAIPKVKSLKVTDVAKNLIDWMRPEMVIDLKEIGIRDGEKLHEEMISSEEWTYTSDEGYAYLIGHYQLRQPDGWSYNSKDSLMHPSECKQFLIDNGVLM